VDGGHSRRHSSSNRAQRDGPTLRRRGQGIRISTHRTRPARRLTCGNPSFRAARPQVTTAAERHNVTVAAARMAGRIADIRRGLTAEAARTAGQAAVDIAVQVPLIAGPAAEAVGDIAEVAVPPIADPAAVAVEDIVEEVVVAVRAEEAVVRAEVVAAVRIRQGLAVAVEGPIGKI
jgi:hypothetical protein